MTETTTTKPKEDVTRESVAWQNDLMIFSTDDDFREYAKILPVKLLGE
jgi:predicted nuclease of predicted toxin-antitoxin system